MRRGILDQSWHVAVGFLAFGAVAWFLPVSLKAQEQQGSTGDQPQAVLEEVVVSARRRTETLRDVPLAVTAVGEASFERQQIEGTQDLSFSVPNLLVTQQTANTASGSIYLRGIGQDDSTPVSEPGVAIYFDDVYMPRTQGTLIDMLGIERVEILRGPQGTLYGRNATGGAIRYVTKKPSFNEFNARVEGTVGSFDRRDVRARINGPLKEGVLGASLDLVSRNEDGYMTRVSEEGNESLNGIDKQLARLALAWQAAPDVMVDFTADYSRDQSDIYVGTPQEIVGETGRKPIFSDPFDTTASAPNENDFRGWGVSASVLWETAIGDFKSITAVRGFDQEFWGDLSSRETTLFDDIFRDLSQDHYTQEFQLASRGEGPLDWLFGVFYMHEEWDNLDLVLTRHASTQETDSIAAFGNVNYNLTPNLAVNAGGRFSRDKKEYAVVATNLFGQPFTADNDETWTDFSPSIGVDYSMGDRFFFFGSWRQGYKIGAFQNFPQSALDVNEEVLEPEDVEVFEVGVKSSWMGGRLTADIVAFFSDYEEIQLQVVDTIDGRISFAGRTAAAEIWGVEAEMVATLSDRLSIYGFVSTLDTEITEIDEADPLLPPEGSKLRFAPELQMKVGFQYGVPVSNVGHVSIGANYSWVDDIQFDTFNREFAEQESFNTLDAYVAFATLDERWRVKLSGKNLTDELYATLIQPSGGPPDARGNPAGAHHYARPETWALSVTLSF